MQVKTINTILSQHKDIVTGILEERPEDRTFEAKIRSKVGQPYTPMLQVIDPMPSKTIESVARLHNDYDVSVAQTPPTKGILEGKRAEVQKTSHASREKHPTSVTGLSIDTDVQKTSSDNRKAPPLSAIGLSATPSQQSKSGSEVIESNKVPKGGFADITQGSDDPTFFTKSETEVKFEGRELRLMYEKDTGKIIGAKVRMPPLVTIMKCLGIRDAFEQGDDTESDLMTVMIEILVQVAKVWVKPKETKVYNRGLKPTKIVALDTWAKAWMETNKALATEKGHSEILMRVNLMLRSVSMALAGFYDPAVMSVCHADVIENLTSIRTSFHPDFSDLVKPKSTVSLLKSWVTKDAKGVHRIPTWLRERVPGCVAIGFCARRVLDDADLGMVLKMEDERKVAGKDKSEAKKRTTDPKTKPQKAKKPRLEDDDDSE
jgi:hypothetical protein